MKTDLTENRDPAKSPADTRWGIGRESSRRRVDPNETGVALSARAVVCLRELKSPEGAFCLGGGGTICSPVGVRERRSECPPAVTWLSAGEHIGPFRPPRALPSNLSGPSAPNSQVVATKTLTANLRPVEAICGELAQGLLLYLRESGLRKRRENRRGPHRQQSGTDRHTPREPSPSEDRSHS